MGIPKKCSNTPGNVPLYRQAQQSPSMESNWQPGFDLPRQQWSLLNRFRTEQGHCGTCRRKWRLTDADVCPCGETQTMSHTHRILSPDKTEWRLISATLCGWRRCFMADQLWFMTCIREEEEWRVHNFKKVPLFLRPFLTDTNATHKKLVPYGDWRSTSNIAPTYLQSTRVWHLP